jgi:prepilin-type N-terminal cleavage/methylation domain-containing protein
MPQVPDGLRARRLRLERAGETGFTLIELVLVLLIIGTLVAIVLPRFPSQTKSDAMTASKTASPANLLYPNGNQAPLGVCGRAGPTTIRPMAATSPLVKATNSTMAKTVATNPSAAAGPIALAGLSSGATRCWITVNSELPQPIEA